MVNREFMSQRRDEVKQVLTVLSGGAKDRIHLAWQGAHLRTVGPAGSRSSNRYIVLITGHLSFAFDEEWKEEIGGAYTLVSSRLTIHAHASELSEVCAIEAEPSHKGAESHAPFKRSWHVHVKEAPHPWCKMHFALYPQPDLKAQGCYVNKERQQYNSRLRNVAQMLRVELVERMWQEWGHSAGSA